MTLASSILSDLNQIMSDWGDSYTQSGQTINGMFDNEYLALNMGAGDVSSAKPAFIRKTTDAVATAVNDTIVVTSELYGVTTVSYKVTEIEVAPADLGPGLTRLILKRA